MSQRRIAAPTWYQSLGDWLLGNSRKKRGFEEHAPEAAAVEFLEDRRVLTSMTGAGTEELAPNSSTTTNNPDGSVTTVTVNTNSTNNSDGSVTTVTTTITTTVNVDGSTTTSTSTSTTTTNPTTNSNIDTDEALAMAVQSDGKIIMVGYAQTTTSSADDANNYDFAVTRLNADGSLDTSFGTNGKKTISFDLGGEDKNQDVASCVAIQADGKIVIGGYVQRAETGNFDFGIVRLNTDGSLDNTFSSDGKAMVGFDYGGNGDDRATGMVIQPDGKIVLVGNAQTSLSGNSVVAICRLHTDGQLDASFTGDGRKWVEFNGGDQRASSVAVQADGKIVVAGYAQSSGAGYDFSLVRVTANGTLDRSFSSDGKKTIGFNQGGGNQDIASTLSIQSDGVIVIGGTAQNSAGDPDFAVARVKSNGSMDKTFGNKGRKTVGFNLGSSNDDQLTGMAIQSDGKIVLGGFSQISASGDYDFAIARLNVDGSLDTEFSTDGKKVVPFNVGGNDSDLSHSVKIQSDGKILIAGGATKGSLLNTDFAITRLNDDGSLDSTFGTNGIKTVPFDLT